MSDELTGNEIAVVGIGMHVPVPRIIELFWENLRHGVESIQRLDHDALVEAGESPSLLRDPNYVPAAAPLAQMEDFDGDFFGFSPKESAIIDPQHRHFFEVAWDALEDAGIPPEKAKGPMGVFAGCGMGSYFYFNLCQNPELVKRVGMFLLRHTGNDKDFLATRLSYLLNLTGPSINVQTACSTSLVAIHMACQSLLSGECDTAIAGGSTIELPHRRGYLFKENEILSPDGHCHAFDHRAALFLEAAPPRWCAPLESALKDGDPIHAVILGTAVNNDGAGKAGYLAPSVDGQAGAIAEAMGIAGVAPDTVGFVECHGTGTYLGDPIEVAALTQAYRQGTDKNNFCALGSVKTNIGHLDTAAGVVGFIKAVLAVKNQTRPATLGFEKPNPSIDFSTTPFFVQSKTEAWQVNLVPPAHRGGRASTL